MSETLYSNTNQIDIDINGNVPKLRKYETDFVLISY